MRDWRPSEQESVANSRYVCVGTAAHKPPNAIRFDFIRFSHFSISTAASCAHHCNALTSPCASARRRTACVLFSEYSSVQPITFPTLAMSRPHFSHTLDLFTPSTLSPPCPPSERKNPSRRDRYPHQDARLS